MTWRLIGLMSVVLFLSLGAFGLLLSLSEGDIMDEVTRTVSTVGTKTLAAFVEFSGDLPTGTPTEGDPANSPATGPRKQVAIRRSFEQGEQEAPTDLTDVDRRVREWVESGAALEGPGKGFVVIRISTPDGALGPSTGQLPRDGLPRLPAGAAGLLADFGSIWLPGAEVQAEGQSEQVRARIPIVRHVQGGTVELDLEQQPSPDGSPPSADTQTVTFRDELVFQVPTRDYQSIFDKIRNRSLFLLMGVFMVGMLLSAGLARRFTRPIRNLDQGLRQLSRGDLDVTVNAGGQQEMARLGQAFNDMTRRLRLARERAREVTRKEKLSALGRLAAGVAHDVRNPLHSINLTLQHLQETSRPASAEAQAEFDRSMDLIRSEIRRLDGLVGNFLAFARSDRQERQSVRPLELIEETARLVSKEAERRGIDVLVEPSGSEGAIFVNAESVRSALLNLVLNAFEALPEGGQVRLGCEAVLDEEQQRRVVFQVSDDGSGITEQDRERVFEFGYTTREGGHGLGLAMVHQIVVEEHAGRVQLESAPGQGTHIRLEFPEIPEVQMSGEQSDGAAWKPRLLVVDDEATQCEMLKNILERDGYQVATATDGERALKSLESECFDAVLTDQRMPRMDGLELLRRIRALPGALPVVLMTAYGSVSSAVEAMKLGAADYLTKPFEKDELLLVLEKVLRQRRLEEEVVALRSALADRVRLDGIVGASGAMQEVFSLIERVADADVSVLITGESGTGKELVARAIHARSRRRQGPFVPLNCAAIPESLLESEFFGHVKGAFTGAQQNRTGSFEQAHGGTLLLDEIGAMRVDLQAKLLRALQEQEIQPLGSSQSRKIDVRILSATSEDLEEAIANRSFREDLFYRLNVVPIVLPPLRDRPEDIPLLIEHFCKQAAVRFGRPEPEVSAEVVDRCMIYAWPGNVREVQNCVERMVVLSRGGALTLEDLPPVVREGLQPDLDAIEGFDLPAEGLQLAELERHLILRALKRSRGSLGPAARLLGITYKTLQYRIRKHRIERGEFEGQ